MGAQIAAHLANAGYGVTLLDVSADAARKGLERARTLKPDPFYTPEVFERVRTGGFDADLHLIEQADWTIEAIIEQAAAKQCAPGAGGRRAQAWLDRQLEHVRAFHHRIGPRPQRRFSAALGRHTFLQPASLSDARRAHSNG